MGDAAVFALLIEWGLEHLAESFAERGIDLEALDLLDDLDEESLKEVFPDPDDLVTFRQKSKMRKATLERMGQSASYMPNNWANSKLQQDDIYKLQQEDPAPAVAQFVMTEPGSSSRSEEEFTFRPQTHNNESALSDIWKLLNGTLMGKSVLLNYKTSDTGTLSSDARTKLVKIICEKLCDENIDCNRNVYADLSKRIVDVFPRESMDIYFTPSGKDANGKYIPCAGKLFDCHKSLRTAYVKLGLLPSKRQRPSVKPPEAVKAKTMNSLPSANEGENILWLKDTMKPWSEVVQRWKESHPDRNWNTSASRIIDDFKTFPVLRQDDGYTLINLDFRIMFPDKEDMLFSKWNVLSQKIRKRCEGLKPAYSRPKELLNIYRLPTTTEEAQVMCTLLMLPSLCPTTKCIKLGTEYWKPSARETEQAFLLHVKSLDEVDQAIAEREAECISRGMNLLPFTLVVAPSVGEPLEQRFVVINREVRYKMDSLLQAVDLCFKTYCVFHSKYPFESNFLYLFMKKYVYEINSDHDEKSIKVAALICDFLKS